MKVETILSRYFKYAGLVMALIFGVAIVAGMAGLGNSVWFTRLGILLAVIIPISGLVLTMVILFRNNETRYGAIVIILLLVLALAVAWRIYA